MAAPALPLIPLPASVANLDGAPFRITADTRIVAGPRAAGVAELLIADLDARLGLSPVVIAASARPEGTIALSLRPLATSSPDAYELVATDAGLTLAASTPAGLYAATRTLLQLIADDGSVPPISIRDEPRFAYRGTMLDVTRHFFPVETVFGVIDRAASLKLNHLHLHLSDDQGWRLELRSRPELTTRASGTAVGDAPGGFYTQDDYRRIVAYAADRFMTVVPEFDMPSHTHAVGVAYPELVAPPVISEEVERVVDLFGGGLPRHGEPYTGIAVGFSSLRTRDAAVADFVTDVVTELAALTPGPYLHLGGDEALGTSAEDYAHFLGMVGEKVAATGKTLILWHEAGAAPLTPGTIGQFWGYTDPTEEASALARRFVASGGRLIMSPADAAYLDMKYDDDMTLGLAWADGPTDLARAYGWDPADVVAGIEEADVLGVEAPLWAETAETAADLDALMFPRLAAAAEIAWTPRERRDAADFFERVGAHGPLWSARGIAFHRTKDVPWAP